jgi:PqqD family protein of HPr-rel-A system
MAQSERKSAVWALMSSGDVLFRSWDDDGLVAVYDGLSGDTHLVSPLAGEILRLLKTGPLTPEMLHRHLAAAFEDRDDADAALDMIRTALSQLQDIHLVSGH